MKNWIILITLCFFQSPVTVFAKSKGISSSVNGDYAPQAPFCGWHVEYAGEDQVALEPIANFFYSAGCEDASAQVFTCTGLRCVGEEKYHTLCNSDELVAYTNEVRFLPDGNMLYIDNAIGRTHKNYRR